MFHHTIDRDTPRLVFLHWFLLSFLGGAINSGGFMACGRFVSHVTGFYTLFGQNAASLSWDAALGIATIPFYFLAGAMMSAFLVERPARTGKRPHYATVMALVFVCLSLAAAFGHFGLFGEFGETHLKSVYLFLALVCMASGLQNGAVTIASGHSVRITHMTGNTTDLGIGIVRTLILKKGTGEYADERNAVVLRTGIITAFALGSAVGAILFLRYRYDAFFLIAMIALYALFWELRFGS